MYPVHTEIQFHQQDNDIWHTTFIYLSTVFVLLSDKVHSVLYQTTGEILKVISSKRESKYVYNPAEPAQLNIRDLHIQPEYIIFEWPLLLIVLTINNNAVDTSFLLL